MKVLVLGGAGAVCGHATRDLAAYSDFDEIIIGEANVAAAEALVAEIGDSRLRVKAVDANDNAALLALIGDSDVVLNGLPWQFDLAVTRACVEAGVSGLDVSTEESQWDYDERAREQGIVFIPGVGATPGTTNAMARRGADLLDEADEVQINFAAFRALAPSPGLLAVTLWEFHPDEEDRVYYQNGEFHRVGPFTGLKQVRFHDQIGRQEVCYIPHAETQTLPRSLGVKAAAVRGCFPPSVMQLMKAMLDSGLYSEEPLEVNGRGTTALATMTQLLKAVPQSYQNDVWAYGLVVEVFGRLNQRPAKVRLWNEHPPQEAWGGSAAYYKNVGIPLSIGVQMIARGQIEARGVIPPETALPPLAFFAELARRDIVIHEAIEEG
ncbi:MAG: saccharopine dehydrogenase NADP-binding domain-containing protein [Candidatus Promineifilaceae bacterium]|nr:saccharopine dehydrogenase NADP-binding domain-containing protein [Candidatus Promineifilaceae bacterium]